MRSTRPPRTLCPPPLHKLELRQNRQILSRARTVAGRASRLLGYCRTLRGTESVQTTQAHGHAEVKERFVRLGSPTCFWKALIERRAFLLSSVSGSTSKQCCGPRRRLQHRCRQARWPILGDDLAIKRTSTKLVNFVLRHGRACITFQSSSPLLLLGTLEIFITLSGTPVMLW